MQICHHSQLREPSNKQIPACHCLLHDGSNQLSETMAGRAAACSRCSVICSKACWSSSTSVVKKRQKTRSLFLNQADHVGFWMFFHFSEKKSWWTFYGITNWKGWSADYVDFRKKSLNSPTDRYGKSPCPIRESKSNKGSFTFFYHVWVRGDFKQYPAVFPYWSFKNSREREPKFHNDSIRPPTDPFGPPQQSVVSMQRSKPQGFPLGSVGWRRTHGRAKDMPVTSCSPWKFLLCSRSARCRKC